MTLQEVQKKMSFFRNTVQSYRDLLSESRDQIMPDIVRNFDEISSLRTTLNKLYAGLEKYINKLGKNIETSDGVWNVTYSPYDNAFTNDTLIRVGRSTDLIINDLDYIIGKLESMNEAEFQDLFISKPLPAKNQVGKIIANGGRGGQGGDGPGGGVGGDGGKGGQVYTIQIPESDKANVSHTPGSKKNTYWKYSNPIWLIWTFIKFLWNHKIISTIVIGILASLIATFVYDWWKLID